MDKKGQVNVGLIIMIAVGIIFAAVIIQQIAINEGTATDLLRSVNESHTLTNCLLNNSELYQVNETKTGCNVTIDRISGHPNTNEWDNNSCSLTTVVVRANSTTNATEDTDYVLWKDTGVIKLKNTTYWSNAANSNRTYVDYYFCGVGYNKDAGARSMAGMWTIFAIIALIAFVLAGVKFEWFK
jgi:hypothetical protein